MWSRRRVIFVGVAGAVAAAAAVIVPKMRSGDATSNTESLVKTHAAMLRALALAMLGPAIPASADERAAEVQRVLGATALLIESLPGATRSELTELFGLLEFKAARILLGYSGNWEDGDNQAVSQFLSGLRESSIAMKQQAYFAFHDLLMGAFYSGAHTWAATGYPGPPKLTQ